MLQYISKFTADAIPASRTCLSTAKSHPAISLGATLGAIYFGARVLLLGVKLYVRPRERFEVLTRAEGLLFIQDEGAAWHIAAIFEVMTKMDELGLTDRVPDTIDRLERRLCDQVNHKLRQLLEHPEEEHIAHIAVLMVGVACSLMTKSQIQTAFNNTAVNPQLVGVVRQCVGCWRRRGGRPPSTPIDMDVLSKVVVLASTYTHTGKDVTTTWNMPWTKVPTVIRAWKAVFTFCDHRWLALWLLIALSTASYGTFGRLRTGHILPSLTGYSSEASTTIQSVKEAVSRQVGVPSTRLPDLEYLLFPLTSQDGDRTDGSGGNLSRIVWSLVAVVGPVLLWTTVKELFDNVWTYFESVLRLQLSRSMEIRILLRAASADTAVLQSATNVKRKGGVDFARATVAAISEVSTFFFTVESSLNGHMTKLVASLCLWRYPTAVILGGCGVMITSWYTRQLWLVVAEAIATMVHNAALPTDVAWREHLVRHGTEVLYEEEVGGRPGYDAVDSRMRLFHPRPMSKCHSYWDCLSSSLTDPAENISTDHAAAHFGLSLLVSASKDTSSALCTIMGNDPPCKWSALVVVAGAGNAQSASLLWARETHALANKVSTLTTSPTDRWVLKTVTLRAIGDLRGYCVRVCPPESPFAVAFNDVDADPSTVMIGLPTTSYCPPASELYGCLRWVGAERQHTMVATAMEAARAISDDHTQGWWNFFTSRLRGQVATLADQVPSIAAAAQVKGSAVMSPAVAATAVDTATLILTNLDVLKRQETRLDRSPPNATFKSPLDEPLSLLFRMMSSRRSRRGGVVACALGVNALSRGVRDKIPLQMAGVVHYGSDSTNDGVWEAMASLLDEDTRGTVAQSTPSSVVHNEHHPTHCLDWYALSPAPGPIVGGMWEGSGWSIEFRNVCFSYTDQGPNILTDLSFTLPAGVLSGLVGPSGTGKSTILSLILMMYAPTKGSVLIQGVDTRELMAVRAARRRIGYYGDMSPLLAHSTISENIALGDAINLGAVANPEVRRHAVEMALKQSEAYPIVATRGNGLLTEVGVQSGFSGGEEQRMLLARALVKPRGGAHVFLLDEPTSALDSYTEARVLANLRQCDSTTVIATHKLVALRDAEWIVVLGTSPDTHATTALEQGSWRALSVDPNSRLRQLLDLQGSI